MASPAIADRLVPGQFDEDTHAHGRRSRRLEQVQQRQRHIEEAHAAAARRARIQERFPTPDAANYTARLEHFLQTDGLAQSRFFDDHVVAQELQLEDMINEEKARRRKKEREREKEREKERHDAQEDGDAEDETDAVAVSVLSRDAAPTIVPTVVADEDENGDLPPPPKAVDWMTEIERNIQHERITGADKPHLYTFWPVGYREHLWHEFVEPDPLTNEPVLVEARDPISPYAPGDLFDYMRQRWERQRTLLQQEDAREASILEKRMTKYQGTWKRLAAHEKAARAARMLESGALGALPPLRLSLIVPSAAATPTRGTAGVSADSISKKSWLALVKRDVMRASKAMQMNAQNRLANLKKIAQHCAREVRKYPTLVVRRNKELPVKAKKVMKEMLSFWKRNERDERELRKKAEKEEIERRKQEEEMREARRQQKKLNFLISQTELYGHFIQRKLGGGATAATAPAAPAASAQRPISNIDFDNLDDEAIRAEAQKNAEAAAAAHQARVRQFDEGTAAAAGLRGKKLNQDQFDNSGLDFSAPSTLSAEQMISQPKMLHCDLKNYQLKGLSWLNNLYEQGINGILADEMGLGKTVQSISLLAHLAETQNIWGPFLIIAPVSTLHNWQQELSRFAPDLKVVPYWGSINDRKVLRKFWNQKNLYGRDAAFHVLVTSYQIVVTDEKYFNRIRWQYMILDEAQALKSSASQRWNILLKFNCRNRLLLTGTPIQNSMQELWALLHFIMPSLFDSHEEFGEWFSKDIENHVSGENQNLDQHQLGRLHMILKPFMLRRVKKDVENELSEKIEIDVPCVMSHRQRKLYEGIRSKIPVAELLQKSALLSDENVKHLMNLVMQFRKVCNHPELFERKEAEEPFRLLDTSRYLTPNLRADDAAIRPLPENPVNLTLPKLVYRDFIALPVASQRNRFDAWAPANQPAFLRLADLSPSEVQEIADVSDALIARWALHLARDRPSRVAAVYARDEGTWRPHAMLRVPPQPWLDVVGGNCDEVDAGDDGPMATLLRVGSRVLEPERRYADRFLTFARPAAIAAPIGLVCSDHAAATDALRAALDPFAGALQNGQAWLTATTSEAQNRASAAAVPGEEEQEGNEEVEAIESFIPAADLTPKQRWLVENSGLGESVGGSGVMGSRFPRGMSFVAVPDPEDLINDSGKLFTLDRLLPKLMNEGHRVLIYCQMTRVIDILEDYMRFRNYRYLRLDGSSKIEDRRDMVSDFQTRSDIFVFLLSTRAGGVGINLTAADTVVFFESDWNPTVDQQAMDRVHRLGQKKQVTIYRLITKGSVEERIVARAKQKHEIQKVVIQGGEFRMDEFRSGREIMSLLLDDQELEERLVRRNEAAASAAAALQKRKAAGEEPAAAGPLAGITAGSGKQRKQKVPAEPKPPKEKKPRGRKRKEPLPSSADPDTGNKTVAAASIAEHAQQVNGDTTTLAQPIPKRIRILPLIAS